jgi:hypothetical protein
MGALNAPDLNTPDLHKILTDDIIKNVKIDLMLRQWMNKHNAPIFMRRRLRMSHSTYHDFTMTDLLHHKSMGEERRRINSAKSHFFSVSKSSESRGRRKHYTQRKTQRRRILPRQRSGMGFCEQCKFRGRRSVATRKNRLRELTKIVKRGRGRGPTSKRQQRGPEP